jgi:hypothetical protein
MKLFWYGSLASVRAPATVPQNEQGTYQSQLFDSNKLAVFADCLA